MTTIFFLYSRATKGGGAVLKSTSSGGGTTATSSSGGGTTATSSSGGGVSTSTQSGGGTTQTSSGGGDHRHTLFTDTGMTVPAPTSWRLFDVYTGIGTYSTMSLPSDTPGSVATYSSSGNHTHSITLPAHSHSFSTPSHTHNVTIENHQHTVAIPNHTHDIDIPDHTHEIEHGIFKLSEKPTAVTIKVDGQVIPYTQTSATSLDLVPYLSRDSNGKIRRGEWHTVEITPNNLGRITAQITNQFFIQSRGGGDY
ncbi:hypothetical protein BC6307_19335 [Sutcliffiella cohnii]|uniref:Uncharacterized protein n=1 Tax=Sutcliffiella cohnii TaxID=33932 RepID=A0A223KUW8_9BACI|nr:hypothetical protein [Sutcliffiella cohnii]AST93256.1 hypothetical protein BC6307_19335 [Sutcliffiella cohnii]